MSDTPPVEADFVAYLTEHFDEIARNAGYVPAREAFPMPAVVAHRPETPYFHTMLNEEQYVSDYILKTADNLPLIIERVKDELRHGVLNKLLRWLDAHPRSETIVICRQEGSWHDDSRMIQTFWRKILIADYPGAHDAIPRVAGTGAISRESIERAGRFTDAKRYLRSFTHRDVGTGRPEVSKKSRA